MRIMDSISASLTRPTSPSMAPTPPGPASVSPIGAEVERVWRASGSVGEFIRTMARFGSYQEFLEHLSGLPEEPEGAKVRDDREPARTHNSP